MKLHERAWQTWPVLTLAARNRQTLTYELLGRLTGMHTPGLGPVLEHVQSYCLLNDLPPLSALVVSKETGLPSTGFVATTDVPRAFIRIFEHDWLSAPCPTPQQLAEATRRLPSNGVPPTEGVEAPLTRVLPDESSGRDTTKREILRTTLVRLE